MNTLTEQTLLDHAESIDNGVGDLIKEVSDLRAEVAVLILMVSELSTRHQRYAA